MSPLVRWKVSGQLSGWKSLLAGLALCCMFGHWWHHLFLQIVILTERDLRRESLTWPSFIWRQQYPRLLWSCVCVCFPCNFSRLLAWIGFTACHFIHRSLAKRISMRSRMNQELFEYVGGKLGEVDLVRFSLCSVPVKRVKTKLLGSLIFKLC